MKKKITLLMIFLTFFSLQAKPSFTATINIGYSYDTNVFSNPLPSFDKTGEWLEWKNEHPFIKRHSIETNISFDTFFHKTDRIGISTTISTKFPLKAESIKPIPETENDFLGNWKYIKFNSLDEQRISLFAGIGPIFKSDFEFLNLGIAIRLSLGAYSLTNHELIMGIQAEPFINLKINDLLYINLKLTYDAHLMKFIDNQKNIYEPNYQMISVAPSIGISVEL